MAKEVVFVCGKKRLGSHCVKSGGNILFLHPAMARSGYYEMPDDEEAKRKYNMAKKIQMVSSPMDLMVSFRSYYQRTRQDSDKECNPFSLLQQTAIFDDPSTKLRATDDRDRIFGLLGLASDCDQLNILIDYKTLTAEDVFINTSKAILSTLDLTVLAFQARAPLTMTGLPSWACDWTANVCLPFGDNTNIDRPFHASGTSTAKLFFPDCPDPKIFRIEGFHVGKVFRVNFAQSSGSAKSLDGNNADLTADNFITAQKAFLLVTLKRTLPVHFSETTKFSNRMSVCLELGAQYRDASMTTLK